jgi:hypothetical protein
MSWSQDAWKASDEFVAMVERNRERRHQSYLVADLARAADVSPYDVLDLVEAAWYELDGRRFPNLRDILAELRRPWHFDRAGEVLIEASPAEVAEALGLGESEVRA